MQRRASSQHSHADMSVLVLTAKIPDKLSGQEQVVSGEMMINL